MNLREQKSVYSAHINIFSSLACRSKSLANKRDSVKCKLLK